MSSTSGQTAQIQALIDRLRAGDDSARKELLNCACVRLTQLTRKMLKGYARIRRWEETDDVFQNAAIRLYRTLETVQPASVTAFYRLAALNIRRELLDLAKHYYGPRGQGARHASVAGATGSARGEEPFAPEADAGDDPGRLEAWAEFHRQVEVLPEEEREIFDLLWYQELSQAEAAALLGVSRRTVKRRWAAARLLLHERIQTGLPDM